MTSREKTQRQLKVSEQIKRIIADIFMKEGFSNISGSYITVTQADISPDLKNCKIFVDIFGENESKILKELNQASPSFRRLLGRQLKSRSTPELSFFQDQSTKNALEISNLIDKELKKLNN